MDIQVSSNFERLVYLANGGDVSVVRGAMHGLRQSGAFVLSTEALQAIREEFSSGSAGNEAAAAMMRTIVEETGEVLDPHTAVGVAVARQNMGQTPMLTLATAHPAKFPDVVAQVTGIRPLLPSRLKHLLDAPESFTLLPNSAEAVKVHVQERHKR
jgi:threonine synthase